MTGARWSRTTTGPVGTGSGGNGPGFGVGVPQTMTGPVGVGVIETWKHSDISDNDRFHGDLDAALGAIQAWTLVMPGSHDLYFTPDDIESQARRIPRAIYRPIPSIWGHRAGNPAKNPADEMFIAAAVRELLEQ